MIYRVNLAALRPNFGSDLAGKFLPADETGEVSLGDPLESLALC